MEDKIFEILDIAADYQSQNDSAKKKTLQKMEAEWETLPSGKNEVSEASILALMMLDEYLKFGDVPAATRWASILIDDKDRPDSGEKELIRGKLAYASGDLEEAKGQFKVAFEKSKGREFEGEDKKYLELLKKK